MRRFHLALLMALAGGSGTLAGAATPAAATLEDLGSGILGALRAGSFDAMAHLLPTAEDMNEALKAQAASQPGGMPPEQMAQFRSRIPEIVTATRQKLGEQFARLREPANEIAWASASMKGVRIKVRDPKTGEERSLDSATLAREKPPAAAVQILLEAGGKPLEIDLQDCFRSSRGWLVMEALALRRP
jgi:hypothetical protein